MEFNAKSRSPRGKTSRLSRRQRIVLSAVVGVVVIVAILGLGLGLGLKNRGGGGGPAATATSSPSPAPIPSAIWEPKAGTSWQIILNSVLDIDPESPSVEPDVEVYDIDMFMHQNTQVIPSLHKLGKKVICYFSAGSYEPNRPDSDRFPQKDMGRVLDGWPDEKWINISSPAILQIMAGRVEIASRMGCDGIDPDNVDGYQNDNDLDLTSLDSIGLMTFLADEAHKRNMSIGLKNAGDIVKTMLPRMQFAVNEQCAEYKACSIFSPFVRADKPVFHIEYPDGAPFRIGATEKDESCNAPGAKDFSTVLKSLDLSGEVQFCDGRKQTTKTFQ
ncbi:glycoside hydrolase superfamily [Podospora australis]|uniref:alpha-galactosidase n=1 Tax=Podospora australis TaxID=1536484 RepID=A0AAN6X0I1_9PEZI|nr:glycoside hydrolase superfamily [Podospora australis]